MIMNTIDLQAEIINIRDLMDRVEELENQRTEMGLDESEQEELDTLTAILESLCANGGDEQWRGDWYPSHLIASYHFVDYCIELVSDVGDLPRNIPHYIEIDWIRTADNIRTDYTSVEILDTTYWYR